MWHLAFYCQTSIFLTANFLLIHGGGVPVRPRKHLTKNPFWEGDPWELERRATQSLHQSWTSWISFVYISNLGSLNLLELLKKAKVYFACASMIPVKEVNGFPPTEVPTEVLCYKQLGGKSQDGRKYMPLARAKPALNILSTNSKRAPWNFLNQEFPNHHWGSRCYRARRCRIMELLHPCGHFEEAVATGHTLPSIQC